MAVAIIDYNAGNIYSVRCALNRIGAESIVTNDERILRSAEHVIFPGVGEARAAMNCLQSIGLDNVIKTLKNPVLGICLGLQLLCRHSQEGDVDGLNIFDTDVVKFNNETDKSLKIPHMGWNTVNGYNNAFPQNLDGEYAYYVHSYYAEVCNDTVATTDYIQPFSAMLKKDNFYATQFHPEKSGEFGELILKTFLSL